MMTHHYLLKNTYKFKAKMMPRNLSKDMIC